MSSIAAHEPAQDRPDASADGREKYTPYYYLWHLVAAGVIAVDGTARCRTCPPVQGVVWNDPAYRFLRPRARIALIDMGVSPHHPNLDAADGSHPRIDWTNALDLASHRFGAKSAYAGGLAQLRADYQAPQVEVRARHLQAIRSTGLRLRLSPDERAVLDRLRDGVGVVRSVVAYDARYAAHGTACAGLAVGTTSRFGRTGQDGSLDERGSTILYYGIDPESEVVPITTSIKPDPEQLIAAFLYAYSQDVDVILFPRDASDPRYATLPGLTSGPARLDGLGLSDVEVAELPLWSLLERIILAVSRKVPIVCAAGNDGRDCLIYPALLAAQPDNGIIAVGSVSYRGYRSGYSNYGDGLTVVAPSDDGEVYNRHQIRLDTQAPGYLDYWVQDVHVHPSRPAPVPYSPERLITLDVPGPRGYADGSRTGPVLTRDEAADDPAALYTEFGGTSGASAIVAGMVALMQRQHRQRQDGPTVKRRLEGLQGNRDIRHWYWLDDARRSELALDAMNGEAHPRPRSLFGSGGLVDARKLLSAGA